jgi:hypothetical protein
MRSLKDAPVFDLLGISVIMSCRLCRLVERPRFLICTELLRWGPSTYKAEWRLEGLRVAAMLARDTSLILCFMRLEPLASTSLSWKWNGNGDSEEGCYLRRYKNRSSAGVPRCTSDNRSWTMDHWSKGYLQKDKAMD